MHRLCMTGTWLVELRLTCLLHRPIKRALSAAGFSPGSSLAGPRCDPAQHHRAVNAVLELSTLRPVEVSEPEADCVKLAFWCCSDGRIRQMVGSGEDSGA